MHSVTIYEFDLLMEQGSGILDPEIKFVPPKVFRWLEEQCLLASDKKGPAWAKLIHRAGRRAIKFSNYVGVVRAPDGFQIEVLPKIGRSMLSGEPWARQLLLDMLCCLNGFRHVRTESAHLSSRRMPLLEVFIREFLLSVSLIVKRGLRSAYVTHRENLFALRGKLLLTQQLRTNLHRADRFHTEHDEFSPNRPENRLLHAALQTVLAMTKLPDNDRLARELCFVFAEIPESNDVTLDFQQVQLNRGMTHYADALAWARLVLDEISPLTGIGKNRSPSLLFPMEALFEAFVAKHLKKQLLSPHTLVTQARTHHLVRHRNNDWFLLKPDLVVRVGHVDCLVLDTKWKELSEMEANGGEKYGLAQSDFYQLYAYGQYYLNGERDVVLIYPKTEDFSKPLPTFTFAADFRLWVIPFCLESRKMLLPEDSNIHKYFLDDVSTSGNSINPNPPTQETGKSSRLHF